MKITTPKKYLVYCLVKENVNAVSLVLNLEQHDKEGACCFQIDKSYCSKEGKRGLRRTPNCIYELLNEPQMKAI